MTCPNCGWAPDFVGPLKTAEPSPVEMEIRRIGDTKFERPITLTQWGCYVVGANEDGVPILTRVDES